MKNLVLLLVSIMMLSLTACLLEEEECLDSGNCDSNVEENDSTLVNCDPIYAPVCGNGKTFTSVCHAEAMGVFDFEEGECGSDSTEVICPEINFEQTICEENEVIVTVKDEDGCIQGHRCELRVVEPIIMD